ncbi:MAG: glycosyltransferase family 39 protein, partial [Planctomycetota bacterium]
MNVDTRSSEQPDPRSARERALPLLVLVGLGLVLRLPRLDQSVWFDEVYVSDQVLGSWPLLLKAIYVDIHPPLYFVFMGCWIGLFGDSEISMRLPPLLCGLLSILLIYKLGERLVDRRTGLVAALLLSTSPVHVWYSIEARPYAVMILLTLAAALLQLRVLAGDASRRTWVLYAVLLLVMAFTHYYLAVVVGVLALLALLPQPVPQPVPQRARRGVVLISVVTLLLMAAFLGVKLVMSSLPTSEHYLRSFGLTELYKLLFQWFLTGNCVAAAAAEPAHQARVVLWVVLQVVGVCLFAWGVHRLFKSAGQERHVGIVLLALLLAIPACLLVLPYIGFEGTYIERSMLPALPFFFLVVAVGLTGLRGPTGIVSPLVCWLAWSLTGLLLVSNLCGYFAWRDEWTVYKPHPDWRAAARYLTSEIDAGGAGRP